MINEQSENEQTENQNNRIDIYIENFEKYNKIQYQNALYQLKLSSDMYFRLSDIFNNTSNKDLAHRFSFIEKLTNQANKLQDLSNRNFKESLILDEMLENLQKYKNGEITESQTD